jgi:hypothetical protein
MATRTGAHLDCATLIMGQGQFRFISSLAQVLTCCIGWRECSRLRPMTACLRLPPQEPVDVWERAARLRAMLSRIGASS